MAHNTKYQEELLVKLCSPTGKLLIIANEILQIEQNGLKYVKEEMFGFPMIYFVKVKLTEKYIKK